MCDACVLVTSPAQFGAKLRQLGLPLLSRSQASQLEPAVLLIHPDRVRETEEVKRLDRKAEGLASLARIASEAKDARLVRMQLQAEGLQALRERSAQGPCVPSVLEARHEVVGVAHDINLLPCVALPPLVDPEVDHVVQIDVRQKRANDAPCGVPS